MSEMSHLKITEVRTLPMGLKQTKKYQLVKVRTLSVGFEKCIIFIHFSSATLLMRNRVYIKRKSIMSSKNQLSQGEFFINTNTEEKSLRALTLITPHHKKTCKQRSPCKRFVFKPEGNSQMIVFC